MQDATGRDVEIKVIKTKDEELGSEKIKYITVDVFDEKRLNITKTAIPVLDLIGASIENTTDHMIEISVMPLDLRNGCG